MRLYRLPVTLTDRLNDLLRSHRASSCWWGSSHCGRSGFLPGCPVWAWDRHNGSETVISPNTSLFLVNHISFCRFFCCVTGTLDGGPITGTVLSGVFAASHRRVTEWLALWLMDVLDYRRVRRTAKTTVISVMSVCLSVCLHEATRLPLNGVSSNLIFFFKCRENSSFIKIVQD
jgi:hypothetical protein